MMERAFHFQHPFQKTLAARLLTVFGNIGTMEVAAQLTSGGTQSLSEKRIPPSIFSYSNLVHAVSGAVGSVVAITVFYPLDTVRTRLQVDDQRRAKHTHEILSDIYREEGIEGLYRGWFPVVTALCCSNFVYFYTFSSLKFKITGGRKSSPLTDLSLAFISGWVSMAFTMWMSSFVYFYTYHGLRNLLLFTFDLTPDPFIDLLIAYSAGCVNVFVTTPLWVANTRLKLQGAKMYTKEYAKAKEINYDGLLDCLKQIVQKEGFWSLWNGTVPSLILAANPAIQFMVYEALKRYFQRIYQAVELSGILYFVIGAVAKAIATVVTYPLQVIQSRMRAGFAKKETTLSLFQNILHLLKTQGFGSLYKGMEAKLFQTILTAALMFLTYEKIAAVTFRLMGLQSPPPKH